MQARFSQCELCFHFKDAIAKAASLEQKLATVLQYRKHLSDQYADRCICWTLQELACDSMSDLLVIQVDGADQSKLSSKRPEIESYIISFFPGEAQSQNSRMLVLRTFGQIGYH